MWISKVKEQNSPLKLLLIEDNPGDVLLAQQALEEGVDLRYRLDVVTDGDSAIRYLFRLGEYTDADIPDLIFLDLNLPRRNGKEILARIKQDSVLKFIPVIIFSTSESEQDIQSSFNLLADNYVVKPFSYTDFVVLISQIVHYWNGRLGKPEHRNRHQFVKRIA